VVPRRISRVWSDQRIGESVITYLVIVLVKRDDQHTVVSLRPLVKAVEPLLEPGRASGFALIPFSLLLAFFQLLLLRTYALHRCRRCVVVRSFFPHLSNYGGDDSSYMGTKSEPVQGFKLAGGNIQNAWRIFRTDHDGRADLGEAFRKSLDREAFGEQLLAEVA